MKIVIKRAEIWFGVIMALAMSFTMSTVMTIANVGFVHNFLVVWLRGFAIGTVVATPTAFLVAPLAKKLANRMSEDKF